MSRLLLPLLAAFVLLAGCGYASDAPLATPTPTEDAPTIVPTVLPTASPLTPVEAARDLAEQSGGLFEGGSPLWMVDFVAALSRDGLTIDFATGAGVGVARARFPLCSNSTGSALEVIDLDAGVATAIMIWAYQTEAMVGGEWEPGFGDTIVYREDCEPAATITGHWLGAIYQHKNLVVGIVEAPPYAPAPLLRSAALDERVVAILRSLEEHDESLSR